MPSSPFALFNSALKDNISLHLFMCQSVKIRYYHGVSFAICGRKGTRRKDCSGGETDILMKFILQIIRRSDEMMKVK